MNDNNNTTITLLFPLFYLALADLKTLLENMQQQGNVGVEKFYKTAKQMSKVHTHMLHSKLPKRLQIMKVHHTNKLFQPYRL